jgi:hypothetical protein
MCPPPTPPPQIIVLTTALLSCVYYTSFHQFYICISIEEFKYLCSEIYECICKLTSYSETRILIFTSYTSEIWYIYKIYWIVYHKVICQLVAERRNKIDNHDQVRYWFQRDVHIIKGIIKVVWLSFKGQCHGADWLK